MFSGCLLDVVLQLQQTSNVRVLTPFMATFHVGILHSPGKITFVESNIEVFLHASYYIRKWQFNFQR